MDAENSPKTSVKQKVAYEFQEFAIISLYLAFFFCALATYSLLLLDSFHVSYFAYGTAVINALVIAKVISSEKRYTLAQGSRNESCFTQPFGRRLCLAYLHLDSTFLRR
jgi:hypothetical protein